MDKQNKFNSNNQTLRTVATGVALAILVSLLGNQVGKIASPSVPEQDILVKQCDGQQRTFLSKSRNRISDRDLEIAEIAWTYFANNTQSKTGLVNSANKYPSTTMWDTGSVIGGIVTARELCLITQKQFDDQITAMLSTLNDITLYGGYAPNKAYNTKTAKMVNYLNKTSEKGIGVSALDLARLAAWLNVLTVAHPKYTTAAKNIMLGWDFDKVISKGQMYGAYSDPVSKKTKFVQEGRLGYEQYAGKVFQRLGFDQNVSADYNNKFKSTVIINDVPIAYDSRDPRELGAYNYVVTESYALDAMEHGVDKTNRDFIDNIFEVQKERWKRTGKVTAVSEDNVDRKPYFVYNTIFTAGIPWNTITDKGVNYDQLKSVSVKAAMSLALLYPKDDYSNTLLRTIESAYDEEKGWYSGVYEDGKGYNKAITANTNGIILTTILYKMYGPLFKKCQLCSETESFAEIWRDRYKPNSLIADNSTK